MNDRKTRPALPARIAAWGLAFLLTVTLTAAILGGPAAWNRILTDEGLHIRTATEDQVIRRQMDMISERIREIAEDYGFSADDVAGLISREDIEDINDRTARWWTRIVSDGVMDEIPAWTVNDSISSVILNSLDRAAIPEDELEETSRGIANEIEKAVNRTVMPFRKALVTLAVRYVNRKTDLAGMIRFASGVPLAAAVTSLFLMGVIAFLLGKRIFFSLKYYGAAFAGAGLSSLTGLVLIRYADIHGMIRAASERLDDQIRYMMKTVAAETWICAAAGLILGIICLILFNHFSGKEETSARQS